MFKFNDVQIVALLCTLPVDYQAPRSTEHPETIAPGHLTDEEHEWCRDLRDGYQIGVESGTRARIMLVRACPSLTLYVTGSREPADVLYRMKLAYEEALFRAVARRYAVEKPSLDDGQEAWLVSERLFQAVILIREDAASAHLPCSLSGRLLEDYRNRLNGKTSPDDPPSDDVLRGR